jgi:hypothetical protein
MLAGGGWVVGEGGLGEEMSNGQGNGVAWKMFGAMVTVNVMLASVGIKMVLNLSAKLEDVREEVAGIKGALTVRVEASDREHAAFSAKDRELEAKLERIRDRLNGR